MPAFTTADHSAPSPLCRIDGSDKFLPVNISDTKKRNHVFPFRGTYEDLPPSDMHAIEVRQSTCHYAMQQSNVPTLHTVGAPSTTHSLSADC